MPAVVALPYRADGGGRAHGMDLSLVEAGALPPRGQEIAYVRNAGVRGRARAAAGVRVKTLISRELFDTLKSSQGLPADTWALLQSHPDVLTRIDASVDGLFVPGGPAAHPTQEGRKNVVDTVYERARHTMESAAIQECRRRNVPVLAVCGGSWRLAAEFGARIVQMGRGGLEQHNFAFNPRELMKAKHAASVVPGSHLSAVLEVDYKGYMAPAVFRTKNQKLEGGELPVNSAHWARSVLPDPGAPRGGAAAAAAAAAGPPGPPDLIPSAQEGRGDDAVLEGFEAPDLHFCIGVQWHPEFAQIALTTVEGTDYKAKHKLLMQNFLNAAIVHRGVVKLQALVRGRRVRRARAGEAPPGSAAAAASEEATSTSTSSSSSSADG